MPEECMLPRKLPAGTEPTKREEVRTNQLSNFFRYLLWDSWQDDLSERLEDNAHFKRFFRQDISDASKKHSHHIISDRRKLQKQRRVIVKSGYLEKEGRQGAVSRIFVSARFKVRWFELAVAQQGPVLQYYESIPTPDTNPVIKGEIRLSDILSLHIEHGIIDQGPAELSHTVGAGKLYRVDIPVKKNVPLNYKFHVRGSTLTLDIKFSVKFTPDRDGDGKTGSKRKVTRKVTFADNSISLIEPSRVEKHDGVLRPPSDGVVTLLWDNRYSHVWQKTIVYSYSDSIIEPKAEESKQLTPPLPPQLGTVSSVRSTDQDYHGGRPLLILMTESCRWKLRPLLSKVEGAEEEDNYNVILESWQKAIRDAMDKSDFV
eukprot:g1972.t1